MSDYSPNATLTVRQDINPELAIFKVRPDSGIPTFTPGQYAELAIDSLISADRNRVERRSYSIASPSRDGADLEFYIVKVPGGYFTPALWELAPGGRLWCGPKIKGKFTLDEVPAQKDLIMVATGTGLAPFVSMLRQHEETPPWRSVVLVHGSRFQHDLGYRTEFEELARRRPWFHYVPTLTREPLDSSWQGRRGRVQQLFQQGILSEVLRKPISKDDVHVLMCGNPDMITDLEALLLAEYGFKPHKKKDPGNIHVERYW